MLNRQRPPAISIQPPNIDDMRRDFGYGPDTPGGYDVAYLNLGAETPQSTFSLTEDGRSSAIDSWARSGFAVYTSTTPPTRNVPLWPRSPRRPTTPKKDVVDRDCGICFEISVVPCRTCCCGTIFCLEHIADWLHGSSSDGRCPACQAPCTLESTTIIASAAPTPSNTRPACASASASYPTPDSRSPSSPSSSRIRKTPPSPLRPKAPSTTSPSSRSSCSAHSTPSLSISIAESTPPTSAAELYSDADADEHHPNSNFNSKSISKSKTRSGSRSKLGSATSLYRRTPGPGPAGPATHLKAEMEMEMSPWDAQVQEGSCGSGETLSRVTSVVGLTLFLYVLLGS